MGKSWDDFEPREYQEFCQGWGEAVLRVLKPGGYLLAFSGTRTYHRMVTGLEDAGFEIRDQIAWMYGSGFPKGYNFDRFSNEWSGWSTALKPGHEPIVLAQKPREGTYQNNIEKYGVGGLNIDDCRIPAPDGGWTWGTQTDITGGGYGSKRPSEGDVHDRNITGGENGRWPANVVLDSVASMMLDAQSGDRPAGGSVSGDEPSKPANHAYGDYERSTSFESYNDSGGASRFFYSSKASKNERNAGLEETNDIAALKPINLMRWLVRLVTPPSGTVVDPFAGSGTTGCACEIEGLDYILIEKREKFAEKIIPQRCKYWSKPENWKDLKEHEELDSKSPDSSKT